MKARKLLAAAAASAITAAALITPTATAAPAVNIDHSSGQAVCTFTSSPEDIALLDQYLDSLFAALDAAANEVRDELPSHTEYFATLDRIIDRYGHQDITRMSSKDRGDYFTALFFTNAALKSAGYNDTDIMFVNFGPSIEALEGASLRAELRAELAGSLGSLTPEEAQERLDSWDYLAPDFGDTSELSRPITSNENISDKFRAIAANHELSVMESTEALLDAFSDEALRSSLQKCADHREDPSIPSPSGSTGSSDVWGSS